MNILQLKYLVAITENDFNITQAAQTLFISQPALSKSISQMEKNVGLLIFERNKGRLSHLTEDGQMIYNHAKIVINEYDALMKIIELRLRNQQGDVTLGIPPLVITTLFADFLNHVKDENSQVTISILEYGGHTLDEMLDKEKIDFAILVDSDKEINEKYHSLPIHLGEYGLFMAKKNPLSHRKRIKWSDLEGAEIAIVDDSYSAYHLFQDFLKKNRIKIGSMITGYSWDYLFASIKDQETMTFLPMITENIINMRGIKATHFQEPVYWKIAFVWRKKSSYTSAEIYLINSFQSYFAKDQK